MQIHLAEIGAAPGVMYGGASSGEPWDAPPASQSSALHCHPSKSNSTKTVRSEMHPAGAFLPRPACRHDQPPEDPSNGQAFLRVDADCVMWFQIIRIALSQV